MGFSGHIPQDVEAAKFFVYDVKDTIELLQIGDVTRHWHDLASHLGQRMRGRVVALLVTVEQQQVGARLGERGRHRAPHPLRGAGDNGDAAAQIKHAHDICAPLAMYCTP